MTSRPNPSPGRLVGLFLAVLLLGAPVAAHSDEPAPVPLDAACEHAASLAAKEPSLGKDDVDSVRTSCNASFAPSACADSEGAAACILAASGLGQLDACAAQFCDPAGGSAPSILEDPSTVELAISACKHVESLGAPLPADADSADDCGPRLIDKLVTEQCIDPIGALFCLGEIDTADGVDGCLATCQLPAGE